MSRRCVAPLIAVVVAAACADPVTAPDPISLSIHGSEQAFVILGNGERLPNDIVRQVRNAGGELTGAHSGIGIAYAVSGNPHFAARLARVGGIESVVPDLVVRWTEEPVVRAEVLETVETQVDEAVAGPWDANQFYPLQWVPAAIQAPEAWAAGYRGAGVRVAILDGGLFAAHPDLAANVDVAASRSFVPNTVFNQDLGTFWHGTHVAGIVGAAINSIGVVGVAPEATLIGVKVLHGGTGAFSAVINGIVYAATPQALGGAGAHIINMSLGATPNWRDKDTKDAIRELSKAIDRATRYAYQQGVTVIASAGNGATNFDLEKELLKLPAQNHQVISISATGPTGWALGETNFERPAYYTDHGKSLVDLGAPGGTIGLWLELGVDQVCIMPFVGGMIAQFCETFDLVLSTSRGTTAAGSYAWAQGTSMAAPVASGVAALIIQKNGGHMHPSQVRSALRQSSLDLGEPGNDMWYGHGWVNAWRAVQ